MNKKLCSAYIASNSIQEIAEPPKGPWQNGSELRGLHLHVRCIGHLLG